jgi:hypothetical protein
MRHGINSRNEESLYQPNNVWIFKMAIGSVSGLFIVAAVIVSFYFSLLTTGALVAFALLAAWISTKLRD